MLRRTLLCIGIALMLGVLFVRGPVEQVMIYNLKIGDTCRYGYQTLTIQEQNLEETTVVNQEGLVVKLPSVTFVRR